MPIASAGSRTCTTVCAPRRPTCSRRSCVTYARTDRPTVVDLGSGTGLSSRGPHGGPASVIGIEPSEDMRRKAEAQTDALRTSTTATGGRTRTGLARRVSAALVLASQALHWMEPSSTLAEVARVLRPGVSSPRSTATSRRRSEARRPGRVERLPSASEGLDDRLAQDCGVTSCSNRSATFRRCHLSSCGTHRADGAQRRCHVVVEGRALGPLIESGHFRWCREIESLQVDRGDAGRFVAVLVSQGDFQTLKKHGVDEAALDIPDLEREVRAALGDEPRPFWWSYRTRIGVRVGAHSPVDAVDALAQQVGVAVVAGVLLDHVDEDPARSCRPRRPARASTSSSERGRRRSRGQRSHSRCHVVNASSASAVVDVVEVAVGSSSGSRAAGRPRRRSRANQLRSTSAMWRTRPSSDIVDGGTPRSAAARG